MALSMIPRATFAYPQRVASWYAGHMAKSLRQMGDLLQDIDLVIEARDARLPLTSINRAFDDLLGTTWGPTWRHSSLDVISLAQGKEGEEDVVPEIGKVDSMGKMREKIVVYLKKDLAEEKYEQPLIKAFKDRLDQETLFIDTTDDRDVRRLLDVAVNAAKANSQSMLDMRILVVGMPNVGKSSLLNALRRVGVNKRKHFQTGNMPGVTRKLTGVVKVHEKPLVYVYDTPGVMVPFLGQGDFGADRGIKFALTAGIKEDLIPAEIAIDYLLWRMNQRIHAERNLPKELQSPTYISTLPLPPTFTQPTDDIFTLLDPLCTKIGALQKGGSPNYNTAYAFLMKWFRSGKLGQWTFDDLAPPGTTGEELDWKVWQSVGDYITLVEAQVQAGLKGEGLSYAQEKKREKQAKVEKKHAKIRRIREEQGGTAEYLRKAAARRERR